MATQLKKLALIDTSDLSTIKTFSIFQEGAADASRQVISIEANTALIENEREVITSKVYNITLAGVFSQSDRGQLFDWAEAQTDLVFCGIGLDGKVLYAEGTIQPVDGFEDNMSVRFSSQREAKGGYNSSDAKHSAEMSYCSNILALYDWAEGSTTNLAGGWTANGSPTLNFDTANEEQGFISDASADNMSRTIYFPFAGESLNFTLEYIAGGTNINMKLDQYDASDVVGTQSTESPSSDTGTSSISVSSDSDIAYLVVTVEVDASQSAIFKEPRLTIDSSTTYTDFPT